MSELHISKYNMQDLLRGITSRSDLSSDNWAAHFANRLKYQWVSTHLRGSPPFAPQKRLEAHDYAALHAIDRSVQDLSSPTGRLTSAAR